MIPKFRAWLKNDKEMIEADEIHWDRGELDFIGDAITFMRKADEIELMQSTGLHDKNGQEIFEGDIVETTWLKDNNDMSGYRKRGEVVCLPGYAGVRYEGEELGEIYQELLFSIEPEIIGNVYQNPELLEAANDRD